MLKVFLSALVLSLCASAAITEPKQKVREPYLVDVTPIEAYEIDVSYVAFSKDAKRLISVGFNRAKGDNLKVWDVEKKKHVRTFDAGGNNCDQFHHASASFLTIAAGQENWQLRKWEIASGEFTVLHRGKGLAFGEAIWPDRDTVVYRTEIPEIRGGPHVLKFFDFEKKKESHIAQPDRFSVLRFSQDRKLVALSFDEKANSQIKVFDWANNKSLMEFRLAPNKDKFLERVAYWLFSSDNKYGYAIIGGSPQPRIEKWDIQSGKKASSFNIRQAPYARNPAILSPDDRKIIMCHGRVGVSIDLETGKEGCPWFLHQDSGFLPTAFCLSPDGKMAAIGGDDGKLRIFAMPKVE